MYILIIFPELSFSFLVLTEIQRNKISWPLSRLKMEYVNQGLLELRFKFKDGLYLKGKEGWGQSLTAEQPSKPHTLSREENLQPGKATHTWNPSTQEEG